MAKEEVKKVVKAKDVKAKVAKEVAAPVSTEKHPKMQEVSYIMLNSDVAKIQSCYSRSDKMILEVDIFNHSAWQDNKQFVNDNVGNVAKFRQKYGLSADLFKKETK